MCWGCRSNCRHRGRAAWRKQPSNLCSESPQSQAARQDCPGATAARQTLRIVAAALGCTAAHLHFTLMPEARQLRVVLALVIHCADAECLDHGLRICRST